MKTHLVCTLGTNPLPVCVAARQLISYFSQLPQPISRLSFITSEECQNYVAEISNGLPDTVKIQPIITVSDAGRPLKIVTAISDKLDIDSSEALHLHYTGGTKALSVHAWQGVAAMMYQRAGGFSSSYLDPRSGEPCIIDNEDRILVPDCRVGQHFSIADLAALHEYKVRSPGNSAVPEWALLLFKALSEESCWQTYSHWYCKVWRPQMHNASCPGPSIEKWPEIVGKLNDFLVAENYSCRYNSTGNFLKHTATRDEVKKVDKLISGTFLEYAMLHSVQQTLERIASSDAQRTNFTIARSVELRRNNGRKYFELDVPVVLGYQLVVISCTAEEQEREIKLKAMEALYRGRQIGGDEARALVICGALHDTQNVHVPDKVQEEVYRDSGRGLGNGLIEVWGRDRWADLERHLHCYFLTTLKW